MTDEPAPSASAEPDPALDRARVETAHPARKWDLLPVLYLLGFAALAGGLVFLWKNPPEGQLTQQQAGRVQTLQSQVDGLKSQVAQLQTQLGQVQNGGAQLGPVQAEVQRLQQQVASLTQAGSAGASAQVAQLATQLQRLEQKQVPDIQPLEQRVAALEQRSPADLQPIDQRLNTLATQIQDIAGRLQDMNGRAENATGQLTQSVAQLQAQVSHAEAQNKQLSDQLQNELSRLDAQSRQAVAQLAAQTNQTLGQSQARVQQALAQVDQRLGTVEAQAKQTAGALDAVAQRATRAAKLQAAAAALAAGQKVGEIPGAPPALARFAHQPAPTEASLRLSFDKYAEQAEKASQPAIMDKQGFGTRLWTRAQQVLTVRQGDRVLLGDPIAGVIAHAREALDAGDLAGAVKSLKDGLSGPALDAMKPWLEAASSLLDARAAIAQMAAG